MNIYLVIISVLFFVCIVLALKIYSMIDKCKEVDIYKKESEQLRHSCESFKLTIKGLEIQLFAASNEAAFYISRLKDPDFLKRQLNEIVSLSSQEQK